MQERQEILNLVGRFVITDLKKRYLTEDEKLYIKGIAKGYLNILLQLDKDDKTKKLIKELEKIVLYEPLFALEQQRKKRNRY